MDFYPRSPCGERRIKVSILFTPAEFLSTLSLRRATFSGSAWVQEFPISIHALLAESDRQAGQQQQHHNDFYPRSPCGERLSMETFRQAFSSISIHALLAESDIAGRITSKGTKISIHALLAESDHCIREDVSYSIIISIHALLAESDIHSPREEG